MIVDRHISLVRLLRIMWPQLVGVALVSVATVMPSVALHRLFAFQAGIDLAIPLVLGTALSIFMGFRTNSAYERWWEARKLWGGIVNDTRSLARLYMGFLGSVGTHDRADVDDRVREFCYRQAAWARILAQQLRGLDPLAGADHLLAAGERAELGSTQNAALAALNRQGGAIRRGFHEGQLDVFQSVCLQEKLSDLTDHQGGCERIKLTVFPPHYPFFTKVFIWVFLVLLGLSLPGHEDVGYFSIPAVFLIGWVFFLVDGIGDYMQDPFENNRNSIPMLAIARTLEINLKELLGEKDLPPPAGPVDGALW